MQLQNALKTMRFKIFQKKIFWGDTFLDKEAPLKGFFEILNRMDFLTIFVNPRKRLESAVLRVGGKISMKPIICEIISKQLSFTQ